MIDVIIPVCNEAAGLPAFIDRLSHTDGFAEMNLVFVDNASTDNSVNIIRALPGITLIQHSSNEGYGASIIDGIKASANERLVIIDADGEYPPECIPQLVRQLDTADVVYATRKPDTMPRLKRIGNRLISSAFNVLFNQHTTDLYTGCKALRRSCLDGITLERKGFEHVLELAVRLSMQGYRIQDFPVDYVPRQLGESKMRHLTETLKYVFWLLRYSLCAKMQQQNNKPTGKH